MAAKVPNRFHLPIRASRISQTDEKSDSKCVDCTQHSNADVELSMSVEATNPTGFRYNEDNGSFIFSTVHGCP